MSNHNKEIRSTLDIVMERAQRFGSLSTEESRRLKEKELMIAGEALAKRCLDGLPFREIEAEVQKRGEDDQKMIVEYLLSGLADAIDIERMGETELALAGIQNFSNYHDVVEKILSLLDEYKSALKKTWRDNLDRLKALKRRELELKGISGSSVEPLAENSSEWLDMRDELNLNYNKRLSDLKKIWKK